MNNEVTREEMKRISPLADALHTKSLALRRRLAKIAGTSVDSVAIVVVVLQENEVVAGVSMTRDGNKDKAELLQAVVDIVTVHDTKNARIVHENHAGRH